MNGALPFLVARTVRNRFSAQVRRLRSPRYVIAVAVACGYFFLLLHRPTDEGVGVPAVLPPGQGAGRTELALMSAVGLALFAAKWWLIGSSNAALAFSPAEVQFLFPAPLSRRTLVLYRIGRAQIPLLVSALFITFLARRAGASLPVGLRVLSVWMLFSTLSLHQMGTALARAGAAQRGRGLRRNALPIVIAGGGIMILFVSAVRSWPGTHGVEGIPAAVAHVRAAMAMPLPAAILWPFRIAIAPSYAGSAGEWALAMGPAMALLILHVAWVLRADTVFEDAAVEASARRAARIARARARAAGAALPTPSVVDKVSGSMAAVRLDRAPPPAARLRRVVLPLSAAGDPAVAVLWKNTLALARGLRLRTMAFVGIAISAVVFAFSELGLFGDLPPGDGVLFLGWLAFMAALFLVVLGPLAIRNDLRQDLLHIDLLRTYPLGGATLVFAEIASSTLALTMIQWLLLAAAYALLSASPADAGGGAVSRLLAAPLADRMTLLAVTMGALPIVNMSSFVVQNAAALLFPGWIRLGPGGISGLEVIGQRILGMLGSLTGLALLLALPTAGAAIVLGASAGGGRPTLGAVLTAALVALTAAAAEIALAIQWLGRRFDRTDAAALAPV